MEAIDPATGLAVTGVKISAWSIYLESSASVEDLATGPFMLVPGPQA